MKKLLILLSIMLSGCTVIDAYLMTHYDPNEYSLITSIRSEAMEFKDQCDDAIISKANANKLASDTQLFMLYSEHIPKNKDLIAASQSLNEIAKGLADQYAKVAKISPAFCKIKFSNVETSADKMQTVIAGRPR